MFTFPDNNFAYLAIGAALIGWQVLLFALFMVRWPDAPPVYYRFATWFCVCFCGATSCGFAWVFGVRYGLIVVMLPFALWRLLVAFGAVVRYRRRRDLSHLYVL